VYGGNDPNDAGVPFLTLRPGDTYNLASRRVIRRAIADYPLTHAFVEGLRRAGPGATPDGFIDALESAGPMDLGLGETVELSRTRHHDGAQFALGAIAQVFASLCSQLRMRRRDEPAGTRRRRTARQLRRLP
jgi:hypothetical protein